MADEPTAEQIAAQQGQSQQTTITNPPSEENPTEKRIKALSGKVEITAKERDEAIARADAATKKAAFAEGFVDVVSANPAAKDHKADIEAKVMAGYSVADATYSVLGPLGKLGNQSQQSYQPITGGSASTIIPNQGIKPTGELSRDELRTALVEAQNKGDLYLS